MKLLTRTTLYFLLMMVPLLTAGGFYLFYQFSREINHEVDQELLYDEIQWIGYVQHETGTNGPFILKTPELLIYPVDIAPNDYPSITDIIYYQENVRANIPYRQLSQVIQVNGVIYQIIIRRSQIQKSLLVSNVTRIMGLVFLGLFLSTILFNWVISKRLWKPFQQTVDKIRKAALFEMEGIHFGKTDIEEFNALNASLNSMANKIHTDFLNMKEFTEDAAHEMQTPLAIAQSKMELLLQDANLSDNQAQLILQSSEAIKRLAKLNQSLLLLAKIENNQYATDEPISLAAVTKKYLRTFQDIINDKQLTVDAAYEGEFLINLHPLLAETLVNNLVGNAIKYNYSNGKLRILVSDNEFSISNTSELPAIKSEDLYRRFSKSSFGESGSNGLGLSIVKKIADRNQLLISYDVQNGMHRFMIKKK
jgi:signal transduction histidine kinase